MSIYFWVKIDKREDSEYYNGILSKFIPNNGWSFISVTSKLIGMDWVQNQFKFLISQNCVTDPCIGLNYNLITPLSECYNFIPSWHQVSVTYNGS